MAAEARVIDPEHYEATPIKGNYTTEAASHLWCASALASIVSCDTATFASVNDDIREALRYLLACEIRRAKAAQAAESEHVQ